MLHAAEEQFITITVAIAVAAVRGVWLNVEAIRRLVSARRGHHRVAKAFVHRAVVGLIAIGPHACVNLRAFIVAHSNDIDDTTDGSGTINR